MREVGSYVPSPVMVSGNTSSPAGTSIATGTQVSCQPLLRSDTVKVTTSPGRTCAGTTARLLPERSGRLRAGQSTPEAKVCAASTLPARSSAWVSKVWQPAPTSLLELKNHWPSTIPVTGTQFAPLIWMATPLRPDSASSWAPARRRYWLPIVSVATSAAQSPPASQQPGTATELGAVRSSPKVTEMGSEVCPTASVARAQSAVSGISILYTTGSA